jgi:hypothetical protein
VSKPEGGDDPERRRPKYLGRGERSKRKYLWRIIVRKNFEAVRPGQKID